MKKFDRLSQLNIQKPCSADWESMSGDEAKRFCGGCQKHVHNLSEMAAEDAEALLEAGPVCVRYRSDHRGRIITRTALIASAALIAVGCDTLEAAASHKPGDAPQNREVMGDMAVNPKELEPTDTGDRVMMGAMPMPRESIGKVSAPSSDGTTTGHR